MISRWPKALFALPMLFLVACDAEPIAPRTASEGGPRLTAGSTPGRPALVSNRIKYRDEGMRPTTGRSGGATLTARALLDREHRVHLDITTGSEEELDAGTGPGNLERIQLKVYDPDGNHVSTSNYNRLRNGGFASYVFSNLQRGVRLQVQANVKGIDPNRSGIVTVTDMVKLRPDLTATALSAPESALLNTPVTIGATIREINGDIGARADCVLSVNGVEADRAAGMWVDAGGNVSCAFSHVFRTTGVHALRIAVTNVTPGDYDDSNNAIAGSILVTQPTPDDFTVEGRAWDLTMSSFQMTRSHTRSSFDGGVTFLESVFEFEEERDGREQWASQIVNSGREIEFPMTIRLRHASNGVTFTDETLADIEAQDVDAGPGYRRSCAGHTIESEPSGNLWVQVCSGFSIAGGVAVPFTRLDHNRWAGEVTYFGRRFGGQWYADECVGDCYLENWSGSDRAGTPLPTLGTHYSIETAFTRDGITSIAAITVPLLPVNESTRFPIVGESCHSWEYGPEWDYYRGTACSSNGSTTVGVRGSAFHRP